MSNLHPDVLAVIPARYGSTRFPGKPLVPLAGKPMVQHVYERVARTPVVRRVIVATDDERIAQAVREFGGAVELTGEHPTGTDRIAEVAARVAARGEVVAWVLNVQGDEPLIHSGDLTHLVMGIRAQPEAVMGTLVYPLRDQSELYDPHVVKAVLDAEDRALYFSRAPIPYPRDSDRAGPGRVGQADRSGRIGWRHLGVYLYRADFLETFHRLPATELSQREQLEQLRALEEGYPIHCIEATQLTPGVDVPQDVSLAESLLIQEQAD